jgi:hypothetical protein
MFARNARYCAAFATELAAPMGNALIDGHAIDEQTPARISDAFTTEDEPIMTACRDSTGGRAFVSLKPLNLRTAFAGTRRRRVVEKRIAAGSRRIQDQAVPNGGNTAARAACYKAEAVRIGRF